MKKTIFQSSGKRPKRKLRRGRRRGNSSPTEIGTSSYLRSGERRGKAEGGESDVQSKKVVPRVRKGERLY